MAAGQYQSFPGSPGGSQSEKKLARLAMSKVLNGKSVLDIGCNEGFFCIEAARRGAARVVGIDQNPRFVEAARNRSREFPQIEYVRGDATLLPNERFDLVLVLSVLHYFEDPGRVFAEILARLKPGGTLILECGVAPGEGRTLKRALRSIDERFFPTLEMLRDVWLGGFAVRYMGQSVPQAGDPIPRSVFHCNPMSTSVVFIAGEGGMGKTILSHQMDLLAPTISTDALIGYVGDSEKAHPAQKALDEARREMNGSIRLAWDAVSRNPEHRKYFVDLLARSIRLLRPAQLIVVEGYLLEAIANDVAKVLGGGFRCWTVSRS